MIAVYVVMGLLLATVLWAVLTYNRLVKNRNLVKEGWSGIDVQLKRRANLIPNLVETVRGYAGHESKVFEQVTEMRARSLGARSVDDQAKAEGMLGRALGGLFAIAENYPELKASANFQELQQQLAGAEDQIEMARRYYNGAVRQYNTLVESFPSSYVAKTYHFSPAMYFELEDQAERATPKVSFSGLGGE